MKANGKKHVVIGALVSTAILIMQMFCALVKVKVILSHYGYQYYSIFQSSNGIFSYLILIESGFSVAYLLKMYAPYAHKDYTKVQSLYMGLEIMLRKVALIMTAGVAIITLVYPFILAQNDLTRLEISVLIALCGIKFVLPYYFTVAKKQILNVVEKSYVISIIDSVINIAADIAIICIASFTDWSFLAIAATSVLMFFPSILIYTIIINHYKKKFNFASNIEPSFEASEMTKDIMAQKISYLADNNIDQIILSTKNLFQTTVYTSFNSVVSYPCSLVNQLISAFRGHMGVKLASDAQGSFVSFRKLLTINYYLATVIACEFILQSQNFVKLWIGSTYSAQNVTIILFAFILFRKCAENTVTIAREGQDLYKESKRYAFLAAMVNLVLSLALVQFWGINGLLIATLIADLFVLDFNNYRLVFERIFHQKLDIWRELSASIISFGTVILIRFGTLYSTVPQESWWTFIAVSIISTMAVMGLTGILYCFISKYMRNAILSLIHFKRNKQ